MLKLLQHKLTKFLVIILLLSSSTLSIANTNTPLKIIIGFPPGGALDTMTRALAEQLRLKINQTIIIDNKPGASTQIALQAASRSTPDGNTLLISPAPPFVMFPLTYSRLAYDPDKDLIPVSLLADIPLVASTNINSPYSTMTEYIEWVKQNPEKGNVGLTSLGGAVHFGLLNFNNQTGMDLLPIAYQGAPNMLADEISGILPVGIDAAAAMTELERAKKIKLLGITGKSRSPLLPHTPSFYEEGISGFELATAWYGAFFPRGTPNSRVQQLELALQEIMTDTDFRSKMALLGLATLGTSANTLQETILKEREGWKPIVQASGFTANQ